MAAPMTGGMGVSQALNLAGARAGANQRMDMAEGKQNPQNVNLREADEPAQSYGTCSLFDGVGGCQIVAGKISPAQTCNAWKPEQAPSSAPPAGGPPAPMM